MPVMVWLADVVTHPEIVLKDGDDPVLVDLYKGKEIEVSDKDPYVIRAIARGLARWKPDPANTTPEGEPSTPLETLPDQPSDTEEAA